MSEALFVNFFGRGVACFVQAVEKERERAAQLEEKRLSLEKSLERLRQIQT